MGSSPIPATRPVGQAVKTPPFHGGNSSSILLRVTKRNKSELFRKSKLVRICFLLLNYHIDAVSERGHATSLFSFFSASCCAFHSANSLCPCSDSKYATMSGRIQRAISIRRWSGNGGNLLSPRVSRKANWSRSRNRLSQPAVKYSSRRNHVARISCFNYYITLCRAVQC